MIRQIDARGKVTDFASGFHEVRGVAFDAEARRVYFVDHGAKDSTLVSRAVP